MDYKEKIIIFTPDNEPYLGEPMLHKLDVMIACFAEKKFRICSIYNAQQGKFDRY